MSTSFEFLSNPVMPPIMGDQQVQQFAPQPGAYPIYTAPQPQPQPQPIINDTQPNIVGSVQSLFKVVPDDQVKNYVIDTRSIEEMELAASNGTGKKRGRPRKEKNEIETINSNEIIRGDDVDQSQESSLYNYAQTTFLLGNALEEIDDLSKSIKSELAATINNRTLKNKQNYIVGLTNSLSQILNTKVGAIREINNSITKAIELDYKKEKDRRAIETSANDDKYIMDMYNAFIQNPMENQTPNILGPSGIAATVNTIDGSSIIRSPIGDNIPKEAVSDLGYLNYLSRLTPEQNAMFYENDPNVKTVVVFDASTGQKFFQVMNMATGQVVPNVEPLDNRFMEDTTIDIKHNIATNNNLRQTYPLVIINQGATKEY